MRRGPEAMRPAGDSRAGSEAGFTLIEVLAALVVTALMVAVVLPYASRLATRWWAGEAAVGTADAWMQAMARMSDDLAEAVPLGLGPDDHAMPAFRAGPDSITFVRPALGRLDALETVTYAIRTSPSGTALVRLSRPFDAGSFSTDGAGGGASATLLDGRLRLRLVEISRDGARRRGWAPSDGMPTGVELSATGDRPGDAPAVPIVMPITAQAPAIGGGATPGF